MGIEDLYSNRRQIRAAWDQEKIPSKELIHDLLQRTFKIAPSKQNLFPFKIHVIEPDNIKDHNSIAGICALFKEGAVNNWNQDVLQGKDQNTKKAPWVLIFEGRLCEPNEFVTQHAQKNNIVAADRFTQVCKRKYTRISNVKLAAVEVGMYIQTLAGLCLENDLAISYIRSYPEWWWDDGKEEYFQEKNKVGFDWSALPQITEHPIMVVQIGYKANMEDPLQTKLRLETKPDIDTLVKYHSAK